PVEVKVFLDPADEPLGGRIGTDAPPPASVPMGAPDAFLQSVLIRLDEELLERASPGAPVPLDRIGLPHVPDSPSDSARAGPTTPAAPGEPARGRPGAPGGVRVPAPPQPSEKRLRDPQRPGQHREAVDDERDGDGPRPRQCLSRAIHIPAKRAGERAVAGNL